MWNRDLNEASERGHVDFPRLREAGVKIQAFTIVTRGLPVIDGFRAFMLKSGWPAEARRSEWLRCTSQLENLRRYCEASKGFASVAQTRGALEENLRNERLSAIVGIEGAHALEGDLSRVEFLSAQGVQFMSLTHLSNNELGGTSTPMMGNRPLTAKGHEMLEAMGAVGMAVDVAHASAAMLPSVLSHPKARPFCSHAGVKGATPLWRNLDDASLKAIADRGGVVGIIFAPQYIGGRQLSDVVRHIEHALKVMGEDGVALGSDFDGMIPLPQGMRDVRDLKKLTALLVQRLPIRIVEKVLGFNFRRFWSEVLA
jgi:membrane dipeptidase